MDARMSRAFLFFGSMASSHRAMCIPLIIVLIGWHETVFSQSVDCTIQWDDAVQLSSDSVSYNAPKLSVDGDTIHVLWYGLDFLGTVSHDGIQYCHSFDGGLTFSPQFTISSFDTASILPGSIASSGSNVYV